MQRSDYLRAVSAAFRWLIDNVLLLRSFTGLKYRLFSLLTLAFIADLGIKIALNSSTSGPWPQITFEIAGPELGIVIAFLLAAAFLISANMVLRIRQQNTERKLLDFVGDPSLPPEIRRGIIENILQRTRNLLE